MPAVPVVVRLAILLCVMLCFFTPVYAATGIGDWASLSQCLECSP